MAKALTSGLKTFISISNSLLMDIGRSCSIEDFRLWAISIARYLKKTTTTTDGSKSWDSHYKVSGVVAELSFF